MCNFEPHQSELTPCGHEDMGIDDQHDYQRYQHTAEEIEIDHVVQCNHSFKQALGHAFRAGFAAPGGSRGVPTCTTYTGVTYFIIMAS